MRPISIKEGDEEDAIRAIKNYNPARALDQLFISSQKLTVVSLALPPYDQSNTSTCSHHIQPLPSHTILSLSALTATWDQST